MQTEARCHHQGPPHFSLQQPGTAVSVKTLVLPQGFCLGILQSGKGAFFLYWKNCVKAKAFSANHFGVSKITTKGQNGGLQYIDQCSYSKDAICVRYSLLNICHNRSNLRNTQNQGSSIHCISTRTREENLLGSHLIVTLPHGGEVTTQPGNKDCWDQGEGNLRGKHEEEEPEECKPDGIWNVCVPVFKMCQKKWKWVMIWSTTQKVQDLLSHQI